MGANEGGSVAVSFGFVSIHAPVMGAKLRRYGSKSYHPCFNPRTRDGCEVVLIP